ncbi:MAG: hypothetical protein U0164_19820 [Gemmatimonadaceae bacterium]
MAPIVATASVWIQLRLFVAEQRYGAERLAVVGRHLHHRGHERHDSPGFRLIHLALAQLTATRVSDHLDDMGTPYGAGVAKRANLSEYERIGELDDVGDAAEVLAKRNHASERLAREVVNGHATVVQLRVRNAVEVLRDERLDARDVLTNRKRAHLLVVTDDCEPVA